MSKAFRAARIAQVIEYVCEKRGVSVEEVRSGECGSRMASAARAVICLLLCSIAQLKEVRGIMGMRTFDALNHLMRRQRERLAKEPELLLEVKGYAEELELEFNLEGESK